MIRALAVLCVALATVGSAAHAQPGGARALGSPVRSGSTPDPAWGAPPAVQDITPEGGSRRFADGHADEVPWADPELDLRPQGLVHFGVLGGGGLLTATSHTALQPDLALGFFLDIAIVPSLSVHLRIGGVFHARVFGNSTTGADGRVGNSAVVVGRAQLLGGIHLWELLALRLGFEVGPSDTLESAATHSGVGWALVSQIGVRLGEGTIEILVEPACDSHELTAHVPSLAGTWGEQPSLRLSLLLAGAF